MLNEQVPPATTELPQVLVCAKSPAFVPVMLTLVIDNTESPLLSVTV